MNHLGRYVAVLMVGAGLVLAVRGHGLPALSGQELSQTPASPAAPQPSATPQPSPVVTVLLAKGIKETSVFGPELLSPLDPTTHFVNTDLPFAIVKVKPLPSDARVGVQLTSPAGPAFALEVKAPPHRGDPGEFDFGIPLYILGTDLETHTGAWRLQVAFNGQPQGETTFQWQPTSSHLVLSKIREELDKAPLDRNLRWRYGAALALLGHDKEAIQELQDVIRLERYSLYYITLGRVYERLGRRNDAIQMFQTALSIHGSVYDAIYSSWAKAHLTHLQVP
jgi:hypothetical protein